METNHEFQVFRKALQQALTHLFDPDYTVPEALFFLVPEDTGRTNALRTFLTDEIKALKSELASSVDSRSHRSYRILSLRYLEGHSQESTSEQLLLSLRSLQRAQRQAVLVLAYQIWSRYVKGSWSEDADSGVEASAERWRMQLDQEISLLTQHSPDAHSNIAAILQAVKRITSARSPQRFSLHVSVEEEELVCSFHPPVLQQILLSILDCLMERAPSEVMELHGQRLAQDIIRIKAVGGKPESDEPLDLVLIEGLLAMQEGCELSIQTDNPLTLLLDIPVFKDRLQHATILFVDDNADLASLFTSYCTGTSYDLVHVDLGALAKQKMAEIKPDLIILDVMLPDVDGWELLISIKADPITANIPIIVCSVVTDTDLALDLGAALYLQKPVWREKFLEAVEKTIMSNE